MSHKASSWLAEIPASALSGSQFRVLFHLCDAHNSKRDPATSCFPSQERLREATGLSNGGLNNALNALEEAGFIRRLRRTEPGSPIQRTYYILGCDFSDTQEQTPENGVGANSTFGEANSTFRGGKLHLSGDYPVSNHKKELTRAQNRPRAASQGPASTQDHPQGECATKPNCGAPDMARLRALANWINSGKPVPPSAVSNTQRDALLAAGLVTSDRLRQLQIY